MLKSLKKRSEGFTIIEVLIVLAIAGLILLIVFLAVPALQRNSRNTQVRNSAAATLGGVNDFISNNQGQLPTGCSAAADGTVTFTGAAGTTASTAKVQAGYTVACDAATPWPMPTATGTITVALGVKCTGNSFSTTATNRSYAAGFVVETSSSATAPQCIES